MKRRGGGDPPARVRFHVEVDAPEVDLEKLEHVLLELLAEHDRPGLLSVVLVDDETIREIHHRFLGEDRATDVISFPLADLSQSEPLSALAAGPFGEVVASVETARREAADRDLESGDEIALYVLHGTLHLVGYDDIDDATEPVMRSREQEYLGRYRDA